MTQHIDCPPVAVNPVTNHNDHFFELSQEMLCTAGFDGYFKKINHACITTLGYSKEELLSQPFIEFVHPGDKNKTLAEVENLIPNKNTQAFENRYICKDGSVRYMLWSVVTVVEERLFYCSARDITDRKKVEQDLQIRTQQFECLINAAPIGVYMVDENLTLLNMNAYSLSAFGVPDLIGRNIDDVLHLIWPTSKADEIIKLIRYTLNTGEPFVVDELIEQRIDRHTTEYYAWQINRIPLSNGKLGVVCYFQDISQRILAQQAIIANERRLRYATESAKLTFVEIDLVSGGAYTPENFVVVMGYTPPLDQEIDASIGAKALLEHVVPDDRLLVQSSLAKFFNGEPVGKIDYRVLGDDHIERWIESKWSTELVVNGKPTKTFATNLNITERKLAELSRNELEDRYHTLFNCMDEGYCVVEMLYDAQHKAIDYRFLEVNDAFEEQSGLANATGKTSKELLPDFNPGLIATYGQVALTGKPIRFEHEVSELNSWFDIYAFRIKTPEKNKIAILFNNITQRKLGQLALIENQERLEAFIMSSSDVIYSMSADWSELKHLSGKDFVADSKKSNTNWLQEYIHPADQLAVQVKIAHAIQTKSILDVEHQVIRIDNTLGWTYSRAVPLFNKQGDITEWFGTASDITDRKHAQKALRESKERFRILFELGPVAMYTVDAVGTIQEFNRNAVTMWGREPKRGDLCERYCGAYKIYSPDGALLLHAENSVATVLNGLIPIAQDVEAILERLDGSKVHVIANVVPLKNSSNEIIGALSCSVDITDRKKVEDVLYINNIELKDAKLAAEKANLAKSEFLSSMSHELRTPLNAILGFAQLLQISKPEISELQQRNVAQILHGGWHLLELINEILDLAQIESGQQNLVLEPVNIEQIMQECKDLLQQQAEQCEVDLQLKTLNCHLHILADKTRLKQIFINLLSNAIKYNKKGGTVTMDCSQKDDTLRISVKDTGDGLNSNELAQLFQPFNRLDKKFSAVEGTGIGLVVSKRLVELMQGTIGVHSTVGVGSEFWVEFTLLPNANI